MILHKANRFFITDTRTAYPRDNNHTSGYMTITIGPMLFFSSLTILLFPLYFVSGTTFAGHVETSVSETACSLEFSFLSQTVARQLFPYL